MKNQKHAPWTAHTVKCVDRDMWVREIINTQGDCVAELSVESTEQSYANPNECLIAAAPELLEALEFLKAWHEAKGRGSLKGVESIVEAYVLPAIRKAKGEL
jgi:hypothetical protein